MKTHLETISVLLMIVGIGMIFWGLLDLLKIFGGMQLVGGVVATGVLSLLYLAIYYAIQEQKKKEISNDSHR